MVTEIDPALVQTKILSYVPNLIGAFVVVVAAFVLFKIVSFSLSKILKKSKIEYALIKIILTIIKAIVWTIAALMIADQLGINVTAALAGIGVAGIAIGFASQDILSNILAGFIIFFDKPFKVGDYITYENKYGRIEEITIRSTLNKISRYDCITISSLITSIVTCID